MFLQTLQTNQLPIPPPQPHQLSMRPPFHHHAPLDHEDTIRLLDRAQPVGHRDRRPAPRGLVQRRLHHLLGLAVQRAGGLVQEQDLGVAQEGARDSDALFLSAREERGFGADGGGEAVSVKGSFGLAAWVGLEMGRGG